MELGTVRQIDIDHEMQTAYLDYAMSVIVARALPDVRDGLKPVQRRILYAMHDMGLRPDRPYKKSARIVGETLGKYHPHGDAAVYEAMARMAQDFSLRYPLVDGQGNFGSIDGDNPAAMRYTEARLAPIAEEMLADIDKDTVDFKPNFDGTLTEPSVLPAVLPNLLVNGAAGIAVGMTTNVPPHNLGEVCDALAYLIDNFGKLDDITVDDLMRFIQGPDFPTGGVVYRFAGENDDGDRNDVIANAYAMGRGQFTVQAQVHIEEMSRNRSRIVITELPYQVNKTRLIERIADLVRDGKLEGINDLRDESDRQGMRIAVEMTRTVEPRMIMSQLFKLTPMQVSFGLQMVALVDGEPRTLPLKKVLVHYLEHRQQVITRRSKFLLERARQRAHILEGLLKALDRIDEVIAIIRRSRTADTARANLIKALDLTEIQAQAILDMPLKRLAALEQKRIADELKERLAEIAYLEGLLRSPAKIRGVIRDELMALKEKYGDARRTRIVDREKGYHTARDLVEHEDVVVTLWRGGEVGRSARSPAVSKAMPVAQQSGSTHDDVVFFAASGRVALAALHQLPDDRTMPVSGLTALDRSETLVGMLILSAAAPAAEPDPAGPGAVDGAGPAAFVTLATRAGRIKRVTVDDLRSAASRGVVPAINVEEGDQLGWVALTNGREEILLLTRQGKAIRFSEEEVRPMGLSAAGVNAIKLAADDLVVGMGIVRPKSFCVTMTEQGYAKRTDVADFAVQKRYGGGIQAAKISSRTGVVMSGVVAIEGEHLAVLTSGGAVSTLPLKAIPAMGRATTGQKSRADNKAPFVDAGQGTAVALAVVAAAAAAGPPPSDKPSPPVRGGPAPKPGTNGKGKTAPPARDGKTGTASSKGAAAKGAGAVPGKASPAGATDKGKAADKPAAAKGAGPSKSTPRSAGKTPANSAKSEAEPAPPKPARRRTSKQAQEAPAGDAAPDKAKTTGKQRSKKPS